jgi:hypothetical protein
MSNTCNARSSYAIAVCCALILAGSAGCQVLGVVGKMATSGRVAPKYTGLAGQSIAVMVWADRRVKLEWDRVQADLASQIQTKLYGNPAKELKDARWPWPAESVVRYQLDHPGIEALPITDVAPKIGVTRLIYVEIHQFSTRAAAAAQMYRGNMNASLKIIEIEGKQGTIGYEESGITTHYPTKSPPEGVLNSNDADIYRGTIAAMAQEIVDRLAGYEPD